MAVFYNVCCHGFQQDRIVEMTLDKEYDVAVQAVRLVINVLK